MPIRTEHEAGVVKVNTTMSIVPGRRIASGIVTGYLAGRGPVCAGEGVVMVWGRDSTSMPAIATLVVTTLLWGVVVTFVALWSGEGGSNERREPESESREAACAERHDG